MAGDGRVYLFAGHPLPDFRVVCDGFEGNVWHGLVPEPTAHALVRVREFVIIVHRRHETLFGEGERHARRIARDPAPPPPLRHVGRGAGTAGGVEYEVAGIGGHEEAALDDLRVCLNDKDVFG